MDVPKPPHYKVTAIYGVGRRFQSLRINDLELVDQICPRWNPLSSWMRRIEDFQRAA
jgi:hypothetical protein